MLTRIAVPVGVFKSVLTYVTPDATNLVLKVFALFPEAPGLSTQDIYRTGLHKFPTTASSTNPANSAETQKAITKPDNLPHALRSESMVDHPFRSVRYLKKFVLESMEENGVLKKVHLTRGAGVAESGDRMDLVTAKGGLKLCVPSKEYAKKDVWLWRLLTEKDKQLLQDNLAKADRGERLLPPPRINRNHRHLRHDGTKRESGDRRDF